MQLVRDQHSWRRVMLYPFHMDLETALTYALSRVFIHVFLTRNVTAQWPWCLAIKNFQSFVDYSAVSIWFSREMQKIYIKRSELHLILNNGHYEIMFGIKINASSLSLVTYKVILIGPLLNFMRTQL